MKYHNRPARKLIALNLALVLLLILLPAHAVAPQAPLVEVGGISFRADETRSGPGWFYTCLGNHGILDLDGQYTGEPIYSSGDLSIYTSGDISIRGYNSVRYGGAAIQGRVIRLYNHGGILTLTGGNASRTSDPQNTFAGDGISAEDFSYCAYGGILRATGGEAPGGNGGFGIAAYRTDGTACLEAAARYQTYPDGRGSYLGRKDPGARIELSGGAGLTGGYGILADGIRLDIDGHVTAGHSYDPWNPSAALACNTYSIGASYPSPALSSVADVTLKAGRDGAPIFHRLDSRRSEPERILSPHQQTEITYPVNSTTPSSIHFYPAAYRTCFLENNPQQGTDSPHRSFDFYPHIYDLSQVRFARPDHYLYGFLDPTPDRLIMAHDLFVPARDTCLEAQWAPYGRNTVLFLGNYGTINGLNYATASPDTLCPVPGSETVSIPATPCALAGWCSVPKPAADPKTGALGADALWLDPGVPASITEQSVFWAGWLDTGGASLRYHGNGGSRNNGSTIALYAADSTATQLRFYSDEDQGFQRPGYRFTGWSRQPVGPVCTADFLVKWDEQAEVYAQWERELPPGAFLVDFSPVRLPGTRGYVGVYNDREQLLTVLRPEADGQVIIRKELYDRMKRARLFQLDPRTFAPHGTPFLYQK